MIKLTIPLELLKITIAKKKFILIIAFTTSMGYTFAQSIQSDVIATTGAYFKSANYTMSWTLGECVTETFSNYENTLTQGFQQSFYNITAVDQLEYCGIKVKAFPNPTTDFITVSIETTKVPLFDYKIELLDIQGRQLINHKIRDKSIRVSMSEYAKGTYFLKVSDPRKNVLQCFKIQKN